MYPRCPQWPGNKVRRGASRAAGRQWPERLEWLEWPATPLARCGPCITEIPHLSRLQFRWRGKGVTILAVTTADPQNQIEHVERMVADKGSAMDYTVAWDDGRLTKDAFLEADGKNSIPCAFVVDANGKLACITHPLFLEAPLQGLVDGTWDAVVGQQKIDAAMPRYQQLAKEIAAGSTRSPGPSSIPRTPMSSATSTSPCVPPRRPLNGRIARTAICSTHSRASGSASRTPRRRSSFRRRPSRTTPTERSPRRCAITRSWLPTAHPAG
ncbi:MAG: TlpA disulfide reductase family protein [Planctomycetota bacterium]